MVSAQKIRRAGLHEAFDGAVLIYFRKSTDGTTSRAVTRRTTTFWWTIRFGS
jgi:hypothetical protein